MGIWETTIINRMIERFIKIPDTKFNVYSIAKNNYFKNLLINALLPLVTLSVKTILSIE